MQTTEIAIIIPCYNEYNRLETTSFEAYLRDNPRAFLYFINDGSTDETLSRLQQINKTFPDNSAIINFDKNKGKATAVREGALRALKGNAVYIGYLDADLSTGFDDYNQIFKLLKETRADFAFGSRIKIENTNIIRKAYRHIAGRIITTIIDTKYKLKIYDTQCGAKIFGRNIVEKVFEQPFYTSWLFDIEIFIRARRFFPSAIKMEIPLTKWQEKKGSKINIYSTGKVIKELIKIYRNY